jgi:hypothetical protein
MRDPLFERWISLSPRLRVGIVILLLGMVGAALLQLSKRSQSSEQRSSSAMVVQEQPRVKSAPSAEESAPQPRQKTPSALIIEEDSTSEPAVPSGDSSTTSSGNAAPPPSLMDGDGIRPNGPGPSLATNPMPQTGTLSAPVKTAAHSPSDPSPSPQRGQNSAQSLLDEVPPGNSKTPVRLAHYRFVLASSGYESNPTEQRNIERIAALERLTQVACMQGMLRSLSYRGQTDPASSNNPLCQAAIERLLALNPGSTSATCARDGIDSPSCYSADADTTLQSTSSSVSKRGTKSMTPSESETLRAQFSSSLQIYQQVVRTATEDKRENLRSELTNLADKLLRTACTSTQISVRERPSVQTRDFRQKEDPFGINSFLAEQEKAREYEQRNAKRPGRGNADDDAGFNAQLPPRAPSSPGGGQSGIDQQAANQKQGEKDLAAPRPLGLVNIVPSECTSALTAVRSFDPALPFLACAERGMYSPRCVQSLRALRSQKKGLRAGGVASEEENEAFSTF